MKLASLSIENVPVTKTKQIFFQRENVPLKCKTKKFNIFL